MAEVPTKNNTMSKSKNKFVQLKEKIQEAFDQTKQELADILNQAVSYCEGLNEGEIREIVSDKALRPSLKALGLQVINTSESVTPTASKAKKGKRRGKVTDEDIIKYLATERTVGEIRDNLGQLIPKRLAGLEKAGKLVMREAGLKKFWKAK